MYDAIVVGARCAGAPTAMLLARAGHRVLLVDRATFPSDIMSTHYIHQPGVARLARWGLLDAVLASNCPPIERIRLDAGPLTLEGAPTPCGDIAIALCPRRLVLDEILFDAAARAGAEARAGFVVEALEWEDGRVSGIRGRDLRGAKACHERAQIVIGADGPWSQVARAVNAPEYETVSALTCGYYSYFSGVRLSACEVHPRPGCSTLGFATNDGLTCVAIERPRSEFETWRADIEGGFLKTLESAPDLCARVRAGKREERFAGTGGIANYFRKPYGPGWWATPAITRIRSPASASPTLFATPNCWPKPPARALPGASRWSRRSQVTRARATPPRRSSIASPANRRGWRGRRRCCWG
jgi:hypothetical protein